MFDRYFASLHSWLDWSQSVMDIWLARPAPQLRRGVPADAAACARLHAESFAHPWPALTFEQMLAERGIHAHVLEGSMLDGFILIRVVADEAEVLSVAVRASRRGKGLGHRLVEASLDELARERVTSVFLEVEEGNAAAIALYSRLGFAEIGRRKGYYRHAEGARDALTMRLDMARRPLRAPVVDA